MIKVHSLLRRAFAATLSAGLFFPLKDIEAQNPLSFHSATPVTAANGNDSAHRRFGEALIKIPAHNFRQINDSTIQFEIFEKDNVTVPDALLKKAWPPSNWGKNTFAIFIAQRGKPDNKALCTWIPRERTRPGTVTIDTTTQDDTTSRVKRTTMILAGREWVEEVMLHGCALSPKPEKIKPGLVEFQKSDTARNSVPKDTIIPIPFLQ